MVKVVRVAAIDLIRLLSALVNLDVLVYSTLRKIKL